MTLIFFLVGTVPTGFSRYRHLPCIQRLTSSDDERILKWLIDGLVDTYHGIYFLYSLPASVTMLSDVQNIK